MLLSMVKNYLKRMDDSQKRTALQAVNAVSGAMLEGVPPESIQTELERWGVSSELAALLMGLYPDEAAQQ